MEYSTIIGTTTSELDDNVNEHLQMGWELYGSPYATSPDGYEGGDSRVYVCQALVKKRKTNTKAG